MDDLLLDTTYLLPIFGLKIDLSNFQTNFSRLLTTYSVLYNPISLVEAKWVLLRLARREPRRRSEFLQRYRMGLKALVSDSRLKQTSLTDDVVETIADKLLLEEKVKDYFDRVIYATAANRGCIFLTEDEEILSLGMRGRLPKPKEIVEWTKIINRIA